MLSPGSVLSPKNLTIALAGFLMLGLTAQAQIFTGSINFLGNAHIECALWFGHRLYQYDWLFSGGQTGGFAVAPDYTPVTFTPFTFSPAPTAAFSFLNFTVIPLVQPVSGDRRNYGFQITSISQSPPQFGKPLIMTGSGYILAFEKSIFGAIFSYSPRQHGRWTSLV